MSPIPPVAIEPESFPWYDYRGYTFSLGLQIGPDDALNSGHSGSAFDPAKGKPDVRGGMGEQAETAYAKQEAILAAAGLAHGRCHPRGRERHDRRAAGLRRGA